MEAHDLDATLKKARDLAHGTDIDALTIKDLKVALKPGSEKILSNTQRASVVTVVILIVDT